MLQPSSFNMRQRQSVKMLLFGVLVMLTFISDVSANDNRPKDVVCKDGQIYGNGVIREVDSVFVLRCNFNSSLEYFLNCRNGIVDKNFEVKCPSEESQLTTSRQTRSVSEKDQKMKKRRRFHDNPKRANGQKHRRLKHRNHKVGVYQSDDGRVITGEAVQWRPYGNDVPGHKQQSEEEETDQGDDESEDREEDNQIVLLDPDGSKAIKETGKYATTKDEENEESNQGQRTKKVHTGPDGTQYDGEDYPQYDYEGQYEGGAPPTQQTDYGQYYDYNYDGGTRTKRPPTKSTTTTTTTSTTTEVSNDDTEESDNETSDNEISDNETSDNEISDNETSDNETSDNETSDNETSDNETSDNETSDNETSDNEISDNEISDNEISDNEMSDNEISDNKTSHNEILDSETSENETTDSETSDNEEEEDTIERGAGDITEEVLTGHAKPHENDIHSSSHLHEVENVEEEEPEVAIRQPEESEVQKSKPKTKSDADEEDSEDGEDDDEDEPTDAETELMYRRYEILSDFYKKHFVDLRVLDTTCEPTEVPPPKIEYGHVKEYLKSENVLLPGKHYHEVVYECDQGYKLTGSSLGHLFCQQKGWTGVQPYCDVDPDAEPSAHSSGSSQSASASKKSSPVMCKTDHGCDHECHVINGVPTCACGEGYELEDVTLCVDIDECEENNGGCQHVCVNKPGTYQCECPEGFYSDNHRCIDKNECVANNGHGPCQDTCINNEGSFSCSCENLSGTVLSEDGLTCKEVDLCLENNGGCSHECYTSYGQSFCMCPAGFRLDNDWKTCLDIDECATLTSVKESCHGRCVNTIGSYQCITTTTEPARPSKSNEDFENVDDQDEVTLCESGYVFDSEENICVDADECESQPCGVGSCANIEAGYECRCPLGYAFDGRTCSDIDECQQGDRCENGDCINTEGSFTCDCHVGYQGDENGSCKDKNECEGNENICGGGTCINLDGSFRCECGSGYVLDSYRCVDVDECKEGNPCGGRARCVNTEGSYVCQCRGHNRIYDDKTKRCRRNFEPCQENPNHCGPHGSCRNLKKDEHHGYTCDCFAGYQRNDNGSEPTCVDTDECELSNGGCHHICENMIGAYRCLCQEGFRADLSDSSLCVDIDECLEMSHSCQQLCINTQGGYGCQCFEGYIQNEDNSCTMVPPADVDTCPDNCSHTCYLSQCTCPENMYLDPEDRATCHFFNEVEPQKPGKKKKIKDQALSCEALDIDEMKMEIHYSKEPLPDGKFQKGTVIRGKCRKGFVSSGGKLRKRCRKDGTWGGPDGQCHLPTCYPLSDLSEGVTVQPESCLSGESNVGQKCRFACKDPKRYKLVGGRGTRCLKTSQWKSKGDPPQCVQRVHKKRKDELESSSITPTHSHNYTTKFTFYEDTPEYPTTTVTSTLQTTTTLTTTTVTTTTTTTMSTTTPTTTTASLKHPLLSGSTLGTTPKSYPVPFIYCPPDVITDLPGDASTVFVRIPQPKTNMNWYDFVKATPVWAKKLEKEMGIGKTLVTFQAISPVGDDSASCSFTIHVRDTIPPRVYNCPTDFDVYLSEGETEKEVNWEEPIFADNVKIKHVMASKLPGNTFAIGKHDVLYEAEDEDGNKARCVFSITVWHWEHIHQGARSWVICRVGSNGRQIKLFLDHVPRGCRRLPDFTYDSASSSSRVQTLGIYSSHKLGEK